MKTFIAILIAALLVGSLWADEPKTGAGPEITVTPTVQYIKVKGDQNKFREDQWTNDGLTEGGEVTSHQDLGKDATLDVQGGGIVHNGEYQLSLDLTKKDLGFIRAGTTQYRKYFDSTGGFFGSFSPPALTLSGDRHLDLRNIFVDIGLRLPNLPKITLGYERQDKDGEKSLLEWGSVTQGTTSRKIAPSSKDINEHTDIFKFDIEHDIKIVHLADQFRYERYANDNTRFNLDAGKAVTVHEEYKHDAYFNTFLVDSHLNEKVYLSLGYLYTTLDGQGGVQVATAPPVGPNDRKWLAHAMDLETESHVVNANAMFGPFAALSFYAGAQAERTETHGLGDALLTLGASTTTTNFIDSSNDKESLSETVGARYTKIPYTTLYAEGRWTEEQVDLQEVESGELANDFVRTTDSTTFRQDYRVGFNTSPIRRITLSGRYRRYDADNDYSHEVDTVAGYPAFITAQDFTTDEIMGKLSVRPCARFTAALTYQQVETDIRTGVAGAGLLVPSGSVQSGSYDAKIYSVSATVTPVSRLYLTGLFSYQDTRTVTFDNGAAAVIAYKGNVYTVIGTAGFALDNKSDMTLEYSYSRADNFTDNSAAGLPLGIDNERHGLIAGISRKFTDKVSARLRYGWYQYTESSNGGVNDYRAQLVAANCTIRF